MKNTAVIGAQWGDEGKGKVSHFLSGKFDIIARFSGGNNAGHTVIFDGRKVKLHHIPSGIFHKDKINILGSGMVINLAMLLEEMEELKKVGADCENLRIAENAHLIFPFHRLADGRQEEIRKDEMLGTTRRGIGPAYTDKAARCGIRVGDLFFPASFKSRLAKQMEGWKWVMGDSGLSLDSIYQDYLKMGKRIEKYVIDASLFVHEAQKEGKKLLLEGAQGVLLDIDWGTYPYVTSSCCTAAGAAPGLGMDPRRIEHVVGITKAYTTRIGTGPFPTEDHGDVGRQLLAVGAEYGTTTGRARRCGWLDLLMLKFSCRVGAIDSLALTKLDVLTGIDPIKVCTEYVLNGKSVPDFPVIESRLEPCEPLYRELKGWDEDITGIRSFADLPASARSYVKFIEDFCGVPVGIISVGPDRDQTIIKEPAFYS
jgi:adenylosuccinate synthase